MSSVMRMVISFSPRKYIEKIIEGYITMFGRKPKQNVTSLLEKGDHPELDTSDYLDFDGITIYQSMVGSLGRIDIQTATMTMSSFRSIARKGHLAKLK